MTEKDAEGLLSGFARKYKLTVVSSDSEKEFVVLQVAQRLNVQNNAKARVRLRSMLESILENEDQTLAWQQLEDQLDASSDPELSILDQRRLMLAREQQRLNDEQKKLAVIAQENQQRENEFELEKQQEAFCECQGKCSCVDAACTQTHCQVKDSRCRQSKYLTTLGIPNPLLGAWRPCPNDQATMYPAGPHSGGNGFPRYYYPRYYRSTPQPTPLQHRRVRVPFPPHIIFKSYQ